MKKLVFGREPVAMFGLLGSIIQAVGLLWLADWNPQAVDTELWLLPVVTGFAGLGSRTQVMPMRTILDAGISPRRIKIRADNPKIEPLTDDKGTDATQG